mgnify:CR=1 FL=1
MARSCVQGTLDLAAPPLHHLDHHQGDRWQSGSQAHAQIECCGGCKAEAFRTLSACLLRRSDQYLREILRNPEPPQPPSLRQAPTFGKSAPYLDVARSIRSALHDAVDLPTRRARAHTHTHTHIHAHSNGIDHFDNYANEGVTAVVTIVRTQILASLKAQAPGGNSLLTGGSACRRASTKAPSCRLPVEAACSALPTVLDVNPAGLSV